MKIAELLRALSEGQVQYVLVMKRAANRPKGHHDIAALEKIKRGEDPNG
jgi:hypothetical protein